MAFTLWPRRSAPVESRSIENPSVPITPAELTQMLGTGWKTAAGITVNQDTALRYAAVLACVRNIAEDISTCPVDVVVAEDGRFRKVKAPRWLEYPNDEMTTQEWIENKLTSALLDGNSYSQIIRDSADNIVEIWPLPPNAVSCKRNAARRLVYNVTLPGQSLPLMGLVNSARGSVAYGDMLHMRAFRQPGAIRGLSPIEYCRQTIGQGMAAQQFGAEFFGQGAHLSGVLEFPGALSPDAARILLATWNAHHAGLANAHEPGVLTEGATWKAISIPPEDAQFLGTMEYSVVDVARIYRMPPHKIQDLTRATFSNIEHQAIEYVIDCLGTWVAREENSLTRLLPAGQRARFDLSGLLKGDMTSRYQAYDVGRRGGWLSADDILSKESSNPLPDNLGAGYWRPLNMAEAGEDESSKGLLDRSTAVLRLIQAGYDPVAALAALRLPPMDQIETPAMLPLPPDPTAVDSDDPTDSPEGM